MRGKKKRTIGGWDANFLEPSSQVRHDLCNSSAVVSQASTRYGGDQHILNCSQRSNTIQLLKWGGWKTQWQMHKRENDMRPLSSSLIYSAAIGGDQPPLHNLVSPSLPLTGHSPFFPQIFSVLNIFHEPSYHLFFGFCSLERDSWEVADRLWRIVGQNM